MPLTVVPRFNSSSFAIFCVSSASLASSHFKKHGCASKYDDSFMAAASEAAFLDLQIAEFVFVFAGDFHL
jgi:hypothetical protein